MAERDDISIVTVDNAAVFITDLFRQAFDESPPRDPTHYVAFAKTGPAQFEAVGYYHVTECGAYGLVGGLCVDPRYRNRGLGEALSRIAFVNLGQKKALFAYLNNPVSVGHCPAYWLCSYATPLPDGALVCRRCPNTNNGP